MQYPHPLVTELYYRVLSVAEADGSWPGAEVVDELSGWFTDHGIDLDIDGVYPVLTVPKRPFRLLRGPGTYPQAVYYSHKVSRDTRGPSYAARDGITVVAEFWSPDNPQDETNQGWAADRYFHPLRNRQ